MDQREPKRGDRVETAMTVFLAVCVAAQAALLGKMVWDLLAKAGWL